MRKFEYHTKAKEIMDFEVVEMLSKLHEFKGGQNVFVKMKTDTLDALLTIAKIQSTEASNKIEGIHTSDDRIKQLALDKTLPKTRGEEEIAGYRDVLRTIHESHDYIHGSDDEHGAVLPLGDEGQLIFGKAAHENNGIGVAAMVANQQEPTLFRHLFQALLLNMDPQHRQHRFQDQIGHLPVMGVVILLGHILVHPAAQVQQVQKHAQTQKQQSAHKGSQGRPGARLKAHKQRRRQGDQRENAK